MNQPFQQPTQNTILVSPSTHPGTGINVNPPPEQAVAPVSIPIANAGSDVTVPPSNQVVLDSTTSYDPLGEPLAFSWVQLTGGPSVLLTGENSLQATFIAPDVFQPVTLTFQLLCCTIRYVISDASLTNLHLAYQ